MSATEEAELGKQDVESDGVRKILDDAAGPAPNIENRPRLRGAVGLQVPEYDSVTLALPVTLKWDQAIEGAMIVIRRSYGVAKLPHPD
jgi:hypothetical protein